MGLSRDRSCLREASEGGLRKRGLKSQHIHVNLSSTCFTQPESNLTMLSVSWDKNSSKRRRAHRLGVLSKKLSCVQYADLNSASVHKLKPQALATKFMTKFQVHNFKQKSIPPQKTSSEMIKDQIRDRKPVRQGIFPSWVQPLKFLPCSLLQL